MNQTPSPRSGGDTLGMLVWTMPVRLLDVSRSGCRVELDRHLPAGTNGQLQIEVAGLLHLDDVRICRCQAREGAGGIYHLGVELLRTRRLSRRSLRLAVRQIIGGRRAPLAGARDETAQGAAVDGREERRKKGVTRSPPVVATANT